MQKFSEILKNLDTMIDGLSPLEDLVVQMENIELLADQAAKRAMMSTHPDPREAVTWKRRESIPMHQILEDAADPRKRPFEDLPGLAA